MSKYEQAINNLAVLVGRIDERTENTEKTTTNIEQHLSEINGTLVEHSKTQVKLIERSNAHTEEIGDLEDRMRKQEGKMDWGAFFKSKVFITIIILVVIATLAVVGVMNGDDVYNILMKLLG